VLGRGTTSLEGATTVSSAAAAQAAAAAAAAAPNTAAPGPSVYMPAPVVLAPEEDRRLIDASRLTVMQAVQEDQAAAVMAGGVTAFSHERPRAHGVGAWLPPIVLDAVLGGCIRWHCFGHVQSCCLPPVGCTRRRHGHPTLRESGGLTCSVAARLCLLLLALLCCRQA
jgi:hypothetical protein